MSIQKYYLNDCDYVKIQNIGRRTENIGTAGARADHTDWRQAEKGCSPASAIMVLDGRSVRSGGGGRRRRSAPSAALRRRQRRPRAAGRRQGAIGAALARVRQMVGGRVFRVAHRGKSAELGFPKRLKSSGT